MRPAQWPNGEREALQGCRVQVVLTPSASSGSFFKADLSRVKELQKIVKQAPEGRQYADKLVKVQLKDCQENWLLIHVEVQGEPETTFELRMYTYYQRILSRYKEEVAEFFDLSVEEVQVIKHQNQH